jgi:hypothetical protein
MNLGLTGNKKANRRPFGRQRGHRAGAGHRAHHCGGPRVDASRHEGPRRRGAVRDERRGGAARDGREIVGGLSPEAFRTSEARVSPRRRVARRCGPGRHVEPRIGHDARLHCFNPRQGSQPLLHVVRRALERPKRPRRACRTACSTVTVSAVSAGRSRNSAPCATAEGAAAAPQSASARTRFRMELLVSDMSRRSGSKMVTTSSENVAMPSRASG